MSISLIGVARDPSSCGLMLVEPRAQRRPDVGPDEPDAVGGVFDFERSGHERTRLSSSVPPRRCSSNPLARLRSRSRCRRDADQTRAEILEVAADEFADAGYAGARVDQIAAHTRTTKRMIYYYFGGKEKLFIAVLERAYAAIRRAEQGIDVEHLDPVSAIRRLAELTFDHHQANPEFVRLVSIENIHRAEHLKRSESSPASTARRSISSDGSSTAVAPQASSSVTSTRSTCT